MRPVLAITVLFLFLLPSCSHASQTETKARSIAMKIEFKRAGGMAPLTNVSGSASVGEDGGDLRSADGKYERKLTSREAGDLRSAADSSLSPRRGAVTAGEGPQTLDGFQYDITVTTPDGRTKKFKINAANKAELKNLSPDIGRILAFVQQESGNILEHRIKTP
jgi:hypothetical protein